MAGGTVIAGELWVPGQKLISIPSGKVFGNEYGINSIFRMIDPNTIEYVGDQDMIVSMTDFYNWMADNASHMLSPLRDPDLSIVALRDKYRICNPEHLVGGSLSQAAPEGHCADLREMWTSIDTLGGGEDLFSDKVYYSEFDSPRSRIRELDTGHRGYR